MNNLESSFAVRGRVLHFLRQPQSDQDLESFEYFPDGVLWIERGYIKALASADELLPKLPTGIQVQNRSDQLILPGFVDTHVHYPQMKVIASYGTQLLEWLEKYTFPEESKFKDLQYARQSAKLFLDGLMSHGTTTALVFCTVHPESVEAFFTEAEKRNLRMIAGKVMMDKNAPAELTDTPMSSYQQSKDLIEKWHNRSRLSYAVTPRFAPTSSPEQLQMAGKLLKEYPDVYLQTHLSEQLAEIEWVQELFPSALDYLDVYDQHGLVTERSVFAHSIHLSDRECRRISQADSAVAFCPSSNLFLGSGLFNLHKILQHEINVGLGTDVGGGTSLSQLRTLHDAYSITAMNNGNLNAYLAFYLATLGGAKALKLDHKIGNFEQGKEADFVTVDMQAIPVLGHRIEGVDDLHEQLFALMTLGDSRTISQTYVMGEPQL